MTIFLDDSYPIRRRSRSLENGSPATDEFRIAEGHRSQRTSFENYYNDSQGFRDRRRGSRKSRRSQYDDKKLEFPFQSKILIISHLRYDFKEV